MDWSGNCGNLTAAVGSFAISNGLVDADRIPKMASVLFEFGKKIFKKPLLRMYLSAMVKFKKLVISSWMG